MRFPDQVTYIGAYAFSRCPNLKNVYISDAISVIDINSKAFYDSAVSYNIFDNAKYLGDTENPYVLLMEAISQTIDTCTIHPDTKNIHQSAFASCENLYYIIIPEKVVVIGQKAFANCSGLKTVVFTGNAPYICSDSFESVSASVSFMPDHESWESKVFQNYGGNLTWYKGIYHNDILYGLKDVATVLAYFGKSSQLVIPNSVGKYSVEAIDSYAFQRNTNLRKITVSDGVKTIGDYAFRDCTALEYVTIRGNLNSIGEETFHNCGHLKQVIVYGDIECINAEAFSECSNLEQVWFCGTVGSIADHVFLDCINLKQIWFAGDAPSNDEFRIPQPEPRDPFDLPDDHWGDCNIHNCPVCDPQYGALAYTNASPTAYVPANNNTWTEVVEFYLTNKPAGNISWDYYDEMPEPIDPEPTDPEPTDPEPTEPEPIDPEPTEPEPTDPEPTDPEPTDPEPTEPEPTEPEPTEPEPTDPESTESEFTYNGFVCVVQSGTIKIVGYVGDAVDLTIPSEINDVPVATIGARAFSGCSSIHSVRISAGIREIGDMAFANCSKLRVIGFPSGVTTIGRKILYNCTNLEHIYFVGDAPSNEAFESPESDGQLTEDFWGESDSCSCNDYLCTICNPQYGSFAYMNSSPKIHIPKENGTWSEIIEYYDNYKPADELSWSTYEAPKMYGASVALDGGVSLAVYVEKELYESGVYTNPYIVFSNGDTSYKVTRFYVEEDVYVFYSNHIAPSRIGDSLYITLNAQINGEAVSSSMVEYGVAAYCYKILESSEDPELRRLVVDLLNYGSSAQLYKDHNTQSLANSRLTPSQQTEGTQADPELQNVLNCAYQTVYNAQVTWKGAGLVLGDSVTVRAYFVAKETDGLAVIVQMGDRTWSVQNKCRKAETMGENCYYVDITGIRTNQMRESIYITVCVNGVPVSNTVRYSVESYVYAVQNSGDTKLANLALAMMRYGDSVAKCFA